VDILGSENDFAMDADITHSEVSPRG